MELKERTTYCLQVSKKDRTAIQDTISALKDLVHQMTSIDCSLLVTNAEADEQVIDQVLIEDSIGILEFLLCKGIICTSTLE